MSAVEWDAVALLMEAEPPVGTVFGTVGLAFGLVAVYECENQ